MFLAVCNAGWSASGVRNVGFLMVSSLSPTATLLGGPLCGACVKAGVFDGVKVDASSAMASSSAPPPCA